MKRLYGKSGNCCAYPQCTEELINEGGNLSDICHIEALNPDGPRYNSSPDITDKHRNGESNLVLLCKNHHHIIDQKDAKGSPYYTVGQLKAMKREHEELFTSSRDRLFGARLPSVLAKVIRELNAARHRPAIGPSALAYGIEEKIESNDIQRYRPIIAKFAAYTSLLDNLYKELEASQMESVLSILNDIYLMNSRQGQSADDTLDRVQDALIERLSRESVITYSEELETCTRIVIIDSFMRCKILEAPAT